MTKHDGKAATCTKKGFETYYTCSCGRGFSDPEGKNQISKPVVIDALGHDYALDATGKLSYDTATDYYDARELAVKVTCDRCNIVITKDSENLEYFSVKPNGDVANSYVISAEYEGQQVSAVYGVKVESTDCVCDSFKVSGTLAYNAEDGTIDTSGLVISDAVCTDCGNAITKASVDVSGAFTDGLVIYCGGASVSFPALNLENYTVASAKTGGNDPAPILTTTFTAKDSGFVCKVITEDFFYAEGKIYSRFELALLNNDNVSVSYDGNNYFYDAKNPITLTKEIRTYGCMLTVTGDITLDLADRWTHNNGIIFGTADKVANVFVKVTKASQGNGIFLWDGADIIINEGSLLNITSSDTHNIWSGSAGSRILVDGTLITDAHVLLNPSAEWTHPDGDKYNVNPEFYVRKGTATIGGNLRVNTVQVGSVQNDYTGKLTVGGTFAFRDENKGSVIRWIFSQGEVTINGTGTAFTADSTSDKIITIDSGITINAPNVSGFIANAWSGPMTVAIHSDAKFNIPEGATMYTHPVANTARPYYGNVWSEATIMLDGETQTVLVANEQTYRTNEVFTYSQADILPVVNADGSRSASAVSAAGSFTTAEGTTRVGDWNFNKATDANGNAIYYYVANAHACENACIQCGKCFNTDCTEEVCKVKCNCYSDEVLGTVEDGFIYNFMSFNIRTLASEGNPINNWDNRKEAVVSFINNSRAHIIGLQEVRKSQFDYINSNLSDKYVAVYFPREGGDNPEGLAIVLDASVFNIVSEDRYWLSNTPDVQSKGWGESYYRVALVLVLENRLNGEFVKTINTHGPLEDVANTNAYQLIMDRSVSENDPFVFLCGDFNATENQIGYVPVANELQDCRVTADESPNRGHITYQGWGSYVDGETPDNVIDFCFVSKGENVDVLTYRVRTDRWGSNNMLSDHYAIQTTVLVKQ